MGLWRRLTGTDDATIAHRLVELWETKVKPDLEAELMAMQQPGAMLEDGANAVAAKEVRVALKALLIKTETRLTVRANEAMAGQKAVKIKKTRETVETETR